MPVLATRRILVIIAATCFGFPGALVACNSILGIEDVRLRTEGGGDGEDAFDEQPFPDDAGKEAGPNLLEVALGSWHTCARKPDLTVSCWGDDRLGQTGTGAPMDGGPVTTPLPVANISDAVGIASGRNHSCAVRVGGSVACWGDNQDGQIGNGLTGTPALVPEGVQGVNDATAVACGGSFSCAIRSGGAVVCWGNGLSGQLGDGTRRRTPAPTAVKGIDKIVALSAGDSHACAVREDGQLLCWGAGFHGQLGSGTIGDALVPSPVAQLADVASVSAAARSTCARTVSGSVFCWGDNTFGQLGNGTADTTPTPAPTKVDGLDATSLWAGAHHACAVRRDATVACWGAALQGQIGDGRSPDAGPPPDAGLPEAGLAPSPSAVVGVTRAVDVGTGGDHSCATVADTIFCWGRNDRAQLGTGEAGAPLFAPTAVVGYP